MKPRLTYRNLEIDKGVNRREITCHTIVISAIRLCNERVYQTLHGGARASTIFPILGHKKLFLSTDSRPPREIYRAPLITCNDVMRAEWYLQSVSRLIAQEGKIIKLLNGRSSLLISPFAKLLTDYCLLHWGEVSGTLLM